MGKILQLFRSLLAWIATLSIAIIVMISLAFGNKRKIWEFWLHAWSRTLLKVLKIKLKVTGLENIKGPAIIAMNHQSIIDIFALPAIAPSLSTFLAKKEMEKVPLVSHVMKACGCILVDRKNTEKAIKSIEKGLKEMPRGCSIIMFPEGTRSRNFKLQEIKKGICHIAIQSKLPIVTIGQYGMKEIGGGSNNIFFKPGNLYLHANPKIETSHWKKENLESHLDEIKTSFEKAILISKKRFEEEEQS